MTPDVVVSHMERGTPTGPGMPPTDDGDGELARRIAAALASRRLTLDDLLAAIRFDDDAYFVPQPRQAPELDPA